MMALMFSSLNENKVQICFSLFLFSEMYPECVIASWDALILLLDAENIERRV